MGIVRLRLGSPYSLRPNTRTQGGKNKARVQRTHHNFVFSEPQDRTSCSLLGGTNNDHKLPNTKTATTAGVGEYCAVHLDKVGAQTTPT